MLVNKLPIKLTPSPQRMLLRPFIPGNPAQVEHILFRVFSIPKKEQIRILDKLYLRFKDERENIRSVFFRHFEHVKGYLHTDMHITDELKQLTGAYFTQQYSLESTALFNPSIVPHPVQDKSGLVKFIISLRAVGEGHISSIVFMEGEIDHSLNITVHENSPIILEPTQKSYQYDKSMLIQAANDLGIPTDISQSIFENLEQTFDYETLDKTIIITKSKNSYDRNIEIENSLNRLRQLALSNFSISFSTNQISARAIYPSSPSQRNGLEDARFVKFTDEDGSSKYFATVTAFNGNTIMPEMLETNDFNEFKISTLHGPASKNKGMALFPRKINGKYIMLGRQDNESIYLMQSDNIYFWSEYTRIMIPTYSWECIQIGNCGSPIEIDEGWLVITHGVGPVRSYSLGAVLLDKNDPSKIIGRLKEPLLEPDKEESYGYVPNVLYTCGAMVINRTLILPYAMSDIITTFATIHVDDILKEMI